MTGRARVRQRWDRLRATDQSGFTLIEVVVATSIMAAAMAMFTTGIVQIYRFVSVTEAATDAQSRLNIVFLRLDKEIRYAAGISTPGSVGVNPYVEYLTTSTGTSTCTQLRLDVANGQLQRRTWTQGVLPVPRWVNSERLASSVTSPQPFTVTTPDATLNFQRLRLSLVFSAGSGPATTTSQSDITFTAVNTSLGTSSATVCTEGRAQP